MPTTTAHHAVTIVVAKKRVNATFLGWSQKYPGYATVMHEGKKLLRKPVTDQVDSDNTTAPVETTFSVGERFDFITAMVNMAVAGTTTALVISGSGGLGKTYTVLQALAENDLGEADYAVIKGYTTARGLYDSLYENNGKIVVFDDCDSVLDDRVAMNLLKGALDTTTTRTVSWNSSLNTGSTPSQFAFTGRIIFISNKPLNKIPQPILSRSLFVDVTMTTAEKLERIRQIMTALKPELALEVKTEVLALIERVSDRIHDLNIRTFIKACEIRAAACPGQDWRRLATYVLITNSAELSA